MQVLFYFCHFKKDKCREPGRVTVQTSFLRKIFTFSSHINFFFFSFTLPYQQQGRLDELFMLRVTAKAGILVSHYA